METLIRGTKVNLVEETNYPFRGSIRIVVNPESPLAFPLKLRIPSWATGASIRVNGQQQPSPAAGSFARIERTWKSNDRVEIDFPLEPRVSAWYHNSVAIERGPLVFSLGIGEDWLKLRDRGMTADWQIYPTTQWNYALAVEPTAEASPSIKIITTESEVGQLPFSARHAPVHLHVKGRKLASWRAEDGVANPVPQSPVTSDEPLETITLIPYAAAKLRITAFPRLQSQPVGESHSSADAHYKPDHGSTHS
jgi:hypothetical protein